MAFSELGYSRVAKQNEMQEYQTRFAASEDIYMYCLDKDKSRLTQIDGTKEELDFWRQVVSEKQTQDMIKRLQENTMEELCQVENEEPFIRFCGITAFYNRKTSYHWIVMAVIEEDIPEGRKIPEGIRRTTEKRFEASMSLLNFESRAALEIKDNQNQIGDRLEEAVKDSKALEQELAKSQILSRTVQKMESEEKITDVLTAIFSEVGTYLNVDEANLIRVNKDQVTATMIAEWSCGEKPFFEDKIQSMTLDELPIMDSRSYVVSSNTQLTAASKNRFDKYGIQAAICLPIELGDNGFMYLNFWEINKKRIWDTDTIRFLHDIKRIVKNILTKRISQNSLISSYAALEGILENIGCGVYVRDPNTKEILFRNHLYRQDFQQYETDRNLQELLHEKTEQPITEIYLEEEKKWYDLQYTQITWVDGRRVQLCTAYDVTEKKNSQREVEKNANTDFLTGLYNRMKCEKDLKEYIRITERHGGEGALLFFDLDDFKHINDGLGHQYGDALLRAISDSISAIAGVENSCYRIGGDEFLIIITNNNFHRLEGILQQLMEIFSKPWYLKNTEYYCTVSMGIVRFPKDGTEVEELMRKADIAMFEAKKSGKNRMEFYDANVTSLAVKRLDMEKNMRRASFHPEEEFEVYYQPIFDVSLPGDPCTGAEALIRWNSANLGFISPAEFIPLAEYLGLITPIGNYILEQACIQCRNWNDSGHPNYKVNVNLSVIQLLQNDMAETIQRVVEKTGIDPANLTLEVTESLAVNDMTYMKKILGKIRSLGVRVALDDFGTGYSSLNHIREMPIDIIKVDRCFVKDLGSDEFSDIFVQTVTQLANAIHVNICVEGVEQKQQYDILKAMKVDLIQGFYFDSPLQLETFLEKYVYD